MSIHLHQRLPPSDHWEHLTNQNDPVVDDEKLAVQIDRVGPVKLGFGTRMPDRWQLLQVPIQHIS